MRKNLLLPILILLLLVLSGTTFAFWMTSNLASGYEITNNQVTVGTAKDATTTVDFSYQGAGSYKLVPLGRAELAEPGSVEFVLLSYEIAWINDEGSANIPPGTFYDLAVTINNISPGNALLASLLTITYQVGGDAPEDLTGESVLSNTDGTIENNGSTVIVYILVTLENPDSISDYDEIVGQTIVFDVTFIVSDPTA